MMLQWKGAEDCKGSAYEKKKQERTISKEIAHLASDGPGAKNVGREKQMTIMQRRNTRRGRG